MDLVVSKRKKWVWRSFILELPLGGVFGRHAGEPKQDNSGRGDPARKQAAGTPSQQASAPPAPAAAAPASAPPKPIPTPTADGGDNNYEDIQVGENPPPPPPS
ncbi:hypothetical protein COOONC_02903 [Cooperia oncophora]